MQETTNGRHQIDTRTEFEQAASRGRELAARLGQTTLNPDMRAMIDELQFTRSHLTEATPVLLQLSGMVSQLGHALQDAQERIAQLANDQVIDGVVTDMVTKKRQA